MTSATIGFRCGQAESAEIVAALLRQLPWTHHRMILGQCKRPEEREFYLRLAVRESWSRRKLERLLRARWWLE